MNMRTFAVILVIFAVVLMGCTIPDISTVNVASVTLNKTSLTMNSGDEETLIATIAPSNATNQNIEWSSNAPAVASVANGKVTAKSSGSATIMVKTQDGGKIETCAVVVTAVAGNKDLTGTITINPTNATVGDTLTATYSGSEMVNYQWKKGTTNIGTNSNKYTPVEAGSYTVTVSAESYKSKTSDPVNVIDTNLPTVAMPTASPVDGTFATSQSVTLTTTTADAKIYYTTNETDPTTASTLYSGAISVSTTTTIKAIAVKEGMNNSDILTAVYTISGDDAQTATYTGKSSNDTYTLKITENTARYTAQIGDAYELTVGSKISIGVVNAASGNILNLQPSNSLQIFIATVSGSNLTALDGTITWTDYSASPGPGALIGGN